MLQVEYRVGSRTYRRSGCQWPAAARGGRRLQVRDMANTQRQFDKELLDVASRERERMGSELHDGLGQELTGAALVLQYVFGICVPAIRRRPGQSAKSWRNGRGFPDAIVTNDGMGMRLMQYRARLMSAELCTHSALNQRVTITCRCPVHSTAA